MTASVPPIFKIVPKVVDIYHGDKVTSFAKAKAFGIRGVIHKATEGMTVTDHLYGDRRKQALDEGLLWGAYHFMRPGDPVAQGDRFVHTIEPEHDTLLAIDHEDEGVSLAHARRFIETVENYTARKVVLYSGFLIKEQLVDATVEKDFWSERRLWLSHYNPHPKWPSVVWPKPWLWQFTGDGNGPVPHDVPGLQTKMDVNSYDGTDEQLAAEWSGHPIMPVPAAAVA